MIAFGIGATGPIVVKKVAGYVESLLPERGDDQPRQVNGGDIDV
jgi:hypothetical protein